MNPCKNSGKCVLDTSVACGFRCECGQSSTGYFCEINNHCASNPCKNGATCENLKLKYHCSCSSKFFGDQCEKEQYPSLKPTQSTSDFCLNRPCLNGGTCHALTTTGYCECALGFTGKYCEQSKI